jgi:hypothetical protein
MANNELHNGLVLSRSAEGSADGTAWAREKGVELRHCNCVSLAKPLQLQNPPNSCQTIHMPLSPNDLDEMLTRIHSGRPSTAQVSPCKTGGAGVVKTADF